MSTSLPCLPYPPSSNLTPELGRRMLTATTVVGLHLLAGLALLSLHQTIMLDTAPAPIRIDLIAEKAATDPEIAPKIPTPVAKPTPQKRVVPPRPSAPPLVHSQVAAPTPTAIAAPETTPTPQPVVPEAREESAAKPTANAAPAIAEPMQAPRFDADYLHNPAPPYPRVSRDLGEEGRVLLRVQVDESGRALQVLVDTGSGFSRLDRAAREAVQNWRFVPAKRGNQPVSGWVKVPVVFELKN